MSRYSINIRIKRGLGFPCSRSWLTSVISETLNQEIPDRTVEMDCVITDNAAIHKLNKVYRGIDKPTDVLSFGLSDENSVTPPVTFPIEYETGTNLGAVVISYPQVIAQAQENNHSVERELTILLIHGILHLLGYDHEKQTDARAMRNREKAILKEIPANLGVQ